MRRVGLSLVVAMSLAAGSVGMVSAAPTKGCSQSGFSPVQLNLTWQPGDAVPAPVDAWWDITVAGFTAEGETAASIAASLGLTVDELYESVVLGIRGVDKNGDGSICYKPFPDTSKGKPAYILNVVDGNAAQH